jgi:hypothetical protein
VYKHEGVEYFLSEDIAQYFEVERNTVNQWVKRNLIVPTKQVRIGRHLHNLFTEQSVKDFANKKYGSKR